MNFNFSDRVLLLTGASGGIGSAAAEMFHAAGARLILADVNEATVHELARSIDPSGTRALGVRYDATRAEDAEAAVRTCQTAFGRIDYLVPAAGIYEKVAFESMTDEQWRRTMSVNLDGVFYICRRAVPAMAHGGAIVMIASQSAHQGASIHHCSYGASKGGVLLLMRSMARELAPRIRVNAISPGLTDTPMAREAIRLRGERALEGTPMGRMGTPREAAACILFLCSDAATYVVGETIHVNGGAYMGG